MYVWLTDVCGIDYIILCGYMMCHTCVLFLYALHQRMRSCHMDTTYLCCVDPPGKPAEHAREEACISLKILNGASFGMTSYFGPKAKDLAAKSQCPDLITNPT